MNKPFPCPENQYVEAALFDLVKNQIGAENKEAFSGGSTLRYVSRRPLAKLLCHYELFKMVSGLPGHIVEMADLHLPRVRYRQWPALSVRAGCPA